MASNSSGLYLTANRNRYNQFSITLGDADGTDTVVESSDIVRAKIGRQGDPLLLEVESNEDTPNESSITAANPTTLSLEAADVAFPAGIYDIEISIWDTGDGRMKKSEKGVFVLRDSMGGDVDGDE